MQLHISTSDGVPIYQQIVNQVKYQVAAGRLRAGEELPPVRTLAEQLVINPNTVARAYRELESAGVVATRRGSGTYVAEQKCPFTRRERVRVLSARADALLAEGHQMDFDTDEIADLVRERGRIMESGRKE